jgi:hypothetical protein
VQRGGGRSPMAAIQRNVQQRGNHDDKRADDGDGFDATADNHCRLDAGRRSEEVRQKACERMEAPSGLEPEPQV